MHKQDIVRLTEQEREQLDALMRKGTAAAYKIKQATLLLKADADGAAWREEEMAAACSGHTRTVAGMRERLVEQGLEAALNRTKPEHPSQQPIVDGEAAARRSALGCSAPPPGPARWTLRLWADTGVELELVASTAQETVRRPCKTTRGRRIGAKAGASPRSRAARVWRLGSRGGHAPMCPTLHRYPWSAWTSHPASASPRPGRLSQRPQGSQSREPTRRNAMGRRLSAWARRLSVARGLCG